MRLFDRIRLAWLTRKPSSQWTATDRARISGVIDDLNREKAVVRWEQFEGEGKHYAYYYDNGNLRSKGFYYAVGYDKKGVIQDEKFQGRNVEYHENGQIESVTFYLDGTPTGEYYAYDEEGSLTFSQQAGDQGSGKD